MFRGKPKLIPQTIIVAPFENKTNDPTMDVFGEQAADWLGRDLSDANFKVVDPRTARIGQDVVRQIPRPFRNGDISVALAEETLAAYVLVGSYYKVGDSIEVNTSVVDVATRERVKSFGPFKGALTSPDELLRRVISPMLKYLSITVDSSAGARLTGHTSPTSLEAFRQMSRAWEHYLANPRDTAPVFAAMDSAARLDTMYAAPSLFEAYIFDVNRAWPQVEQIVRRVRPLESRMSRLERAAMELFDADLRGNAVDRVAIAHRIADISPGSTEAPLLAVVSELYVGRSAAAVATIRKTDPDRGMNLKAASYWEWRAEAEHAAGVFSDEAKSVQIGKRRFPRDIKMTFADVRVLATRNDRGLARYLEKQGAARSDGEIDVALFAAQELRAHGHAARADSIASALAAEVPVVVNDTSHLAIDRFANVLYEARRYDRARDLYALLVARDSTDIDAEGRLAAAAAHLGDAATVARIDSHLASLRRPFLHGRALRWRATLAAVANRPAEATALLEQAVREGHRLLDVPNQLTVHLDPDWAVARTSAPYTAMIAALQTP
jgi:TolB-like protein/tetratricopeptide (TPR) repeat protein